MLNVDSERDNNTCLVPFQEGGRGGDYGLHAAPFEMFRLLPVWPWEPGGAM